MFAAPLFGEGIPVAGMVRAPGGMPAPGVTVTIRGAATGVVVSDADGHFQLSLPPGKYKIHVSLLGFESQERDVEFQVGEQAAEVEFTLALAASEA